MTDDGIVCGLDNVELPDHEAHHNGVRPKATLRKRLSDIATNRLALVGPCAVPGISLTNYSKTAQNKGWGAPCTQARTTITLSNGVRITVASRIARLSTLVLNEAIRRGYVIRAADTGAYNCRKIAGSTAWSNHAWALAIDINWNSNPYTTGTKHDIPDWMADLLNRYGFAWGGDYSGSRRDYMHFEFMGTPAQADAATNLAERELGNARPAPSGGLPVHAVGSRVLYLTDPHMTGTDVKKLQETLLRWYPSQPWGAVANFADGDFGNGTDRAVRYFQGKAGLTVDGEAGSGTFKALGF